MRLKPFDFETPEKQVADALRRELGKDESYLRNSNSTEPLHDSSSIKQVKFTEKGIEDVLESAGIDEDVKVSELDNINTKFKKLLTKAGGSLSDVAQMITNIAMRGETDSARLRASELIAKVHGVELQLESAPAPKDVTINIYSSGESKNLMNFLLPKS